MQKVVGSSPIIRSKTPCSEAFSSPPGREVVAGESDEGGEIAKLGFDVDSDPEFQGHSLLVRECEAAAVVVSLPVLDQAEVLEAPDGDRRANADLGRKCRHLAECQIAESRLVFGWDQEVRRELVRSSSRRAHSSLRLSERGVKPSTNNSFFR